MATLGKAIMTLVEVSGVALNHMCLSCLWFVVDFAPCSTLYSEPNQVRFVLLQPWYRPQIFIYTERVCTLSIVRAT